jgi:hypothetical protein
MARPDFGEHEIEHEGVRLTCRYFAPDLTMTDLMRMEPRQKQSRVMSYLAILASGQTIAEFML